MAQLKASSKCPKVESFTSVASMPPSADPTTADFVHPTAAVDPSPSSSGDASIWSMLDAVRTVHTTHGQPLLDVLSELHALQANLVSTCGSTPQPSPFNDEP